MLALIDGDIFIYRAGFAAQRTIYQFVFNDGSIFDFQNNILSEVKKELKKLGINNAQGKLQKLVDVEPIENACFTIKSMLNKLLAEVQADEYVLYLTSNDKSNYRYEVAKTKIYKGNRKSSDKPQHYQNLRDYLTTYWDPEMVFDKEADDALGIKQCQCIKDNVDSVICTTDKDLRMIPGTIYNFVTQEFVDSKDPGELFLSGNRRSLKGTGYRWFYAQMLLGDSADNIPGIKGLGPVAVYSKLKSLNTEKKLAEKVFMEYNKNIPPKEARKRMLEVADLLWIQREEGEFKSEYLKELI